MAAIAPRPLASPSSQIALSTNLPPSTPTSARSTRGARHQAGVLGYQLEPIVVAQERYDSRSLER
ncbi:MAG: hypothetical protein J6386_23690 [Candidatus Synoicihabitans palmerolidicus]|nr:hypothetical protein [Candidatus Synoicihabitans palmerolidicus]